MRQVVLGKSSLEVSAVGFGGIPIKRLSEDGAVRLIQRAIDLGVTFFDTANSYSDSQRKIGLGIKGRREGLVLATKTASPTGEGARKDIERSLRELGVDAIDLYQLHSVNSLESWQEMKECRGALEALTEARREGLIGHIGFSTHSLDVALKLLAEPIFETVQFPFNLVTTEAAELLVPEARRHKLGFIVMKPLCGGQFTDARLAFKFLNGYPDLLPIPGFESEDELQEVVRLVESGRTLSGRDKKRAERIAAELGRLFCRRCGYCQPCSEGIPLVTAMSFESILKRFPREHIRERFAPELAARAGACAECGECESRCPYKLPIVETVKRAGALAREIVRAASDTA